MFEDSFGDSFGARPKKRGGKKRGGKKRGRTTASCRVGTISFRTRRGKLIEFRGKKGPGCPPRKKPSTRHLAVYKRKLADAAKMCKGQSLAKFRRCVARTMPQVL
jgi:hypothetical protein